MDEVSNVCIKIKTLRIRLNMSQERFGTKLGVSGKTISAYETGKSNPSLKVLDKISKIYDVSILSIKEDKKSNYLAKLEKIKTMVAEFEELFDSGLSL